ncbi:MAG: DUF1559 domain-containing protein [Verrucomicrobia bacterium]|nr:DUF1559 domain-containing protein [Verrucomicrobiota bacterium]
MGELRGFVLGMANGGDEERRSVEQVFAGIESAVQHSGLEQLAGVGLSGIAVEPGLYRTRMVFERKGGADGYIWRLFGTQAHPLGALEWLPADTVWAAFGDVDLPGIWGALKQEATRAGFRPLLEGMEELSANVRQATGRSLEEQLASHGGEIGVALTLDTARRFELTLPGGGEGIELPEPALLVAIKVKDDALFGWIETVLSEQPESVRGQTETARWRSVPVPVPVSFPVRFTVARLGDYLLLASSDRLIERVDQVRAGKAAGLRTSTEWQRLAKGLPAAANSFSFVSVRFGEALSRVQKAVMEQAAREGAGPVPDVDALQRLLGLSPTAASYAVSWADASGWQVASQGTQEPVAVVVGSAVVAPTAVMAAMVLPALAKAKSRAQDLTCMNNLKQIALGMIMYANDHDDALPPDFASIKEYVGTPKVFQCPAAGQPGGGVTWEDFDFEACAYEFVAPGQKITEGSPATTVIARCKIHGIRAYMDGHVERGSH